ncbi:MAG: flagellar basal body-associated FliL family protein [Pseudomonadota bacterium]
MAEEDQPDFDNIEEMADAEKAAANKSKLRRMVMFGGGGLALLAAVGSGAMLFVGGTEPQVGPDGEQRRPAIFYDLPEMTINLSSADQRAQYLRINVSLELRDRSDTNLIEPVMPRVLDAFQVYLRELRSTDLEGSAGVHRLKEELTRRVNIAIYPAEINGVLFREILVQ